MALLEQRLADALGDAAMRLPVQDASGDRTADIIDCGVAVISTAPVSRKPVCRRREAGDRQGLIGGGDQRSPLGVWEIAVACRRGGDLDDADLAVGTATRKRPAVSSTSATLASNSCAAICRPFAMMSSVA